MKNKFTKLGYGLMLTGLLSLSSMTTKVWAQEENKFSMDVTLNSDVFFGFYPFFAGSYSISPKTSFTFYGILWSGGTGASWGNWTEFGIGISREVSKGVTVSPQIGLLNGSLTSGLGTPVLGEGIVPNLTIGVDKEKLESEIYVGYYYGLNHGNATTLNFLHYWANGGIKLSPMFSAGLHLEQLRFTGGSETEPDAAYDYYLALGPYVQFADPKGGAFARFTSGADLRNQANVDKSEYRQPSFFKLTVGYSF